MRFFAVFGGMGSDLGDRDAMENRTIPSPSPRPLPRGEGERASASSRFGKCRLRSHASKLGAKAARPTLARPNALAHFLRKHRTFNTERRTVSNRSPGEFDVGS